MSVSWEALCEDIRRARPPLSYQLIHETARMIDTGRLGVCVQCGQPTVPDEFAVADGAGVRCPDVLACWERRHPRQQEEDEMSRQSRADAAGYAAIHDAGPWETMSLGKVHGSSLYGGAGHVPKSVSVGRKGQGKILTPKEIRQIRRQQAAGIKAARKAAKRGKK